MNDPRAFEKLDEQERIYAPESVPGTNLPSQEVDVGGTAGADTSRNLDPPAAAPVASVGSGQSTQAAPPNIGQDDPRRTPGDPEPDARYPIGETVRDDTP